MSGNPSAQLGILVSQARANRLAYLNKKRRCSRKNCGCVFTELENIGSWACDWYHPAFYLPRKKLGQYACCMRDEESEGCVRADHIDTSVDSRGRIITGEDDSKTFDRMLPSIKNCTMTLDNDDMVLFEHKETRFTNPEAWKASADGSKQMVVRLDFEERRRRLSETLSRPIVKYDLPRHRPY